MSKISTNESYKPYDNNPKASLTSAARELIETENPNRLDQAITRREGYMIPGTTSQAPLDLVGDWDAKKSREAKDLAILEAKQLGEAWEAIGGLLSGAAGLASKIV